MSEENKENKDNKKSKKTIRIIIAIVFVVLLIICAIINLLVNQRPTGPIMTPEEIHRRDSLHNAYIKERDSIEMAQNEANDGV